MSENQENNSSSLTIMGGFTSIIFLLLVFSIIGEPDLLDQLIAIARNYSETIKCK